MSLSDLQRWMRWAVTDRNPKSASDLARAKELVVPMEGLQVYVHAYLERLIECLKSDFPYLYEAAGDDRFREIVSEYLEKYPSRSYTAGDLGWALSEYLKGDPLEAPARLDWARQESFYSADVEPFDLDGFLQTLAPEQWGDIQLKLHPSVRFLEPWVIYRGEPVEVDALAFRVLQALGQGTPLGELSAESLTTTSEELSHCFNVYFPDWKAKGIVVGAQVQV